MNTSNDNRNFPRYEQDVILGTQYYSDSQDQNQFSSPDEEEQIVNDEDAITNDEDQEEADQKLDFYDDPEDENDGLFRDADLAAQEDIDQDLEEIDPINHPRQF